ncbi:MAG: histidine phosphatase family protein [Planctomycetota bacterium]
MKKLLLIRHAKSDWSHRGRDDHDRPLNERGRHDAPMMARRLADKDVEPDLLLTSTARRARKTAQRFRETLELAEVPLHEDGRLYLAEPDQMLEVLRGLPGSRSCVAVFGHNPGISELVELLTGADLGDMPTCAVAIMEFDGDFAELAPGRCELVDYDFPKNRPGGEGGEAG